jgi:hypothetical protein
VSQPVSFESGDDTRPTLVRCRLVAGLLAALPLVVAVLFAVIDLRVPVGPLGWPAAIGGVIAPLVAHRLFALLRSRVPMDTALAVRGERYLSALLVALGVTEAAALAGVLIAEFTGESVALIGLATHVLTAVVLWPNDERVRGFHGESRS